MMCKLFSTSSCNTWNLFLMLYLHQCLQVICYNPRSHRYRASEDAPLNLYYLQFLAVENYHPKTSFCFCSLQMEIFLLKPKVVLYAFKSNCSLLEYFVYPTEVPVHMSCRVEYFVSNCETSSKLKFLKSDILIYFPIIFCRKNFYS